MLTRTALLFLLSLLPLAALAVPSIFEPVMDGVYVVRDDTGQWGGDMSKSITHQCSAPYQARKTLDLTAVPEEVWERTRSVRLSAYFMVRDYSWHDHPPANGLDEAFEVVVNGKVHRYPTSCGAPVFAEGMPPSIDWYDFELPKGEFTRGANEVIIRKAPSDKDDDYLYLGIDHCQERGNSAVTFDGKEWRGDALTIPGGRGEYMVRLYLLARETTVGARWRPGQTPALNDPGKLIAYAGSRDGQGTPEGVRLAPGQSARMEWDARALDPLQPLRVVVEASGEAQFAWLDAAGKPVDPATTAPPFQLELPAGRKKAVSGVEVTAMGQTVTVTSASLEGDLSYHPIPKPIDMRPRIAPPAGQPKPQAPVRAIRGSQIVLSSTGLSCRFEAGDRLRLVSLRNRYTDCEMVRDPAQVSLFLVEVGGKRYAGSRDFQCRVVTFRGKAGFVAQLSLPDPALRATLTAAIEQEGLRLGLSLANAGTEPLDFKLAFPHLAGLTASGTPSSDYYFFPWGGGIIADRPALIRRGYGDHEALYQLMDLFSPERGGGLYIRADDREGWHKTLALRKHVPGAGEEDGQRTYLLTEDEYKWTNPLDPVEGTGFAYEYLRRTREPGHDFRPADAVLAAHPGDWHVAMRAYADWAHRVWRFRPYPSRLRTIHHMIAAGWGQDVLFRDGKYRTDFIQPNTDCIELMSWWEWSPLGPWSTPFDKIHTVLSDALYRMWEPYFVKDPVTGQTMWNNQPGDYDGYNARFGGLPAFRGAIQTYRDMGAFVTLYTDPIRCDDASKIGQAHGRDWGVVGADGEPVRSYEVWNMCHDVAEYRQWVADTMKRVMRETGADGIRLDEYGHRGWACFSKLHQHTFAEPGVTQWQKAIAETTRLVREGMDEVSPGSVLTTEHPGYDYLMQFIDGCITYDLTVQATPLRPLECDAQRFYFPECKAYELDHQSADLASKKKFWNAVESFGRYYPAIMYAILKENEDAYQTRECEPLVPTLLRYVYANRFSGGGKTIYHLYNATGHTVDDALLDVTLRPDQHLFDLLNSRELPLQGSTLRLYLGPGDVACVALLPRCLDVATQHGRLQVNARPPRAGCRLAACDAEGSELLSSPAREGPTDVDLGPLAGKPRPACLKLLCGRDLVDVVEVPRPAGR